MYATRDIVEKLRAELEVEEITTYLYQEYGPDIRSQARKWKLNASDTKDLVQNVMVIFLHKVNTGKFKGGPDDNLGGYLNRIASNLIYRKNRGDLRRGARENAYQKMSDDSPPTPEELLLERDYLERSWVAFRKLCVPCQQILIAFYRDGLKLAEIGEKYELGAADTVKVRKFRCMKEFKKLLKL